LPLTGSQVQRIAGGSEAGVRKVLARLARQGIVHVTPAGASLLYTANRGHLAWPAVEILTSMADQLEKRIATRLGCWNPVPIHGSMFGSAARRDGGPASDIDLFILRPDGCAEDSEPWATQVDVLRTDVTVWTGNQCQVFQLDWKRFAEHVAAGDPLIGEWRRDAITLHGDSPSALLGTLGPGA
jgi:hypothetical protein